MRVTVVVVVSTQRHTPLNSSAPVSSAPHTQPSAPPAITHLLPQLVESLRGLLYDELPIYLARMSRANLGAKLRTGGPSVMLDELTAGVADRATRYLATSQQLLSVPTTSLESTADTYTVYLDRAAGAPATYPDTTTNGAPYYFGMLLSPDKCVRWRGLSGWAGGRMCGWQWACGSGRVCTSAP